MIWENVASTNHSGDGGHQGFLTPHQHLLAYKPAPSGLFALTAWVACPYEINYCSLEVSRGR